MALNNTALNYMADEFTTRFPYLAIHTADPGATGINQSTASRQAANWSAAANGDVTATNIAFNDGGNGEAAAYVGYWSAATAGEFGGSRALTGDAAFNAAGEYTVDSVTENGSSS